MEIELEKYTLDQIATMVYNIINDQRPEKGLIELVRENVSQGHAYAVCN